MLHAQVRGACVERALREDGLSSVHANANASTAVPGTRVKRQQRSVEEKRRIVEGLRASETPVTEFARTHGLRANQIFKWRRLYQQGLLNAAAASERVLLPVKIAEPNSIAISKSRDSNGRASGIIHIEFAKARVSIEGNADAATVRAVLECLAG